MFDDGSSPLTRGKPCLALLACICLRLIPAHAGKTACRPSTTWSWGAHPRSRGENSLALPRARQRRGSSPLTRGKRVSRSPLTRRRGLIPAHAGKTRHGRQTWVDPGAHPRSRGENPGLIAPMVSSVGSSPLTRGKHHHCHYRRPQRGLIPAHAGKTRSSAPTTRSLRAHPRSRGENAGSCGPPHVPRGSSPLTRGKLAGLGYSSAWGGLIPAHAGKTTTPLPRSRSWWAHPRSRGENDAGAPHPRARFGSSPLTRGKLDVGVGVDQVGGLIPAHAGKTFSRSARAVGATAHPRSRGENPATSRVSPCREGSSPLTRGKLIPVEGRFLVERLIPAHAGKTCGTTPQMMSTGAHPRSRGENGLLRRLLSSVAGSSPLTRGKRDSIPRRRMGRGLIPAHAGKTLVVCAQQLAARAHPRSRGENTRKSVRGSITAGSSPLTRGKLGKSEPRDPLGGLIPAHAGKTHVWVGPAVSCQAHPRSRGENILRSSAAHR